MRTYSLSTAGPDQGLRISVKLEPRGVGSGYLHTKIRVGDTIEAAAPRGTFALRSGTRPVALISAGVGATPVLAMLHALAAADDTRPVWWVHGARDRAEHAFAAEVDRLLEQLPDAHRVVAYSRSDPARLPGRGFDAAGRISLETITNADIPVDADYYICGPDGFMRDLSASLLARGTPPEQVAMEAFGAAAVQRPPGLEGDRPAPHAPAGPPGPGPDVTFSRSGLTASWDPSYTTCSSSPRRAMYP